MVLPSRIWLLVMPTSVATVPPLELPQAPAITRKAAAAANRGPVRVIGLLLTLLEGSYTVWGSGGNCPVVRSPTPRSRLRSRAYAESIRPTSPFGAKIMIRIRRVPYVTAGPAFLNTEATWSGIQSWVWTNWLDMIGSQKVKMPPKSGPTIEPRPPITAPTRSWKDNETGNVSGLTNPVASA